MSRNSKKRNKQSFKPLVNWRVNFLFLLVIGIMAVIFHRLYELQILEHERLEAKAQEQHQFFEKLKAQRGQIYIKDGNTNSIPIATNEQRNTVYIVPKNIVDKEGVIKTLSSLFLIDEQEVRRKVMKEDDLYEVIKRKITQEQSKIIEQKNMRGVEMFSERWRHYPQGNLASKIIGFVGYNKGKRVGQYGIEGYFNEQLEGQAGFVKAEKDTSGRWISINQRVMEKPKHGTDIVLTLDHSVQYFVENLLNQSVEKYGAASGSIIVMDPNTGKIIAMAESPSYNNNEFNKVEDPAIFKNNCISSQYEPGSVFKPITAS
ncbi:MAG: hypothetical protein GF335_03415, partial [Candidatus Moranbacteria bacterium]|nr:hypothetical protein [Candidatus Moranbacteria bacterium]